MIMVRLAGRALAPALLLASNAVFAEAKVGADVAVNAGYATNPYGISSGSSAGSGTVTGDFSPTVTITSPTGDSTLSGHISHTEYFRRYGGTTAYSLGGATNQKLSELTSINGSLGFSSSVRNSLFPILDPTSPTDPNNPINVDPTGGNGLAERTNTFNGALGLRTSISAYDSLGFSARAARVRYPDRIGPSQGYDSYGGGASYSRTIGPATSIGISFDLGRSNYESGTNDSTQYSPAATFSTRLAERVSLDLSAGVTISHFNQLTANSSQTSFSGSIALCYIGDLSRFCANGSRRVSATSFSGTALVTSFGANYSVNLTPRSSISGNAAYAQSRALTGLASQNNDYGYGSVSYNRQILERLSAVVTAAYSDSSSSLNNPRANFSGTVGLRYRLGEL